MKRVTDEKYGKYSVHAVIQNGIDKMLQVEGN